MKEQDFIFENGWENIPPAEWESYRAKINASQGRTQRQIDFSAKVVDWCFKAGIVLLIWLLCGCNPQVMAWNQLYKNERKSTQKVQKRWVAGRPQIKPWTTTRRWR